MFSTEFNPAANPDLMNALFAIRKALPPVPTEGTNSLFGSKYVTLQTLMAIANPLFIQNDLLVLQSTSCESDSGLTMVGVETMVVHTPSGQSIRTLCYVPCAEHTAHSAGSAITYARRYGMMALLGAVPADDDGNEGSKPEHKSKSAATLNAKDDLPF